MSTFFGVLVISGLLVGYGILIGHQVLVFKANVAREKSQQAFFEEFRAYLQNRSGN